MGRATEVARYLVHLAANSEEPDYLTNLAPAKTALLCPGLVSGYVQEGHVSGEDSRMGSRSGRRKPFRRDLLLMATRPSCPRISAQQSLILPARREELYRVGLGIL